MELPKNFKTLLQTVPLLTERRDVLDRTEGNGPEEDGIMILPQGAP